MKARRFFREKTIDLLNKEYEFWELTPKNGQSLEVSTKNAIKWEFKGTVYRLGKNGNSLLLAMEKPKEADNDEDIIVLKYEREYDFHRIKPLVEANFVHRRCVLSKKDEEVIQYLNAGASSFDGRPFAYSFDDD
jgi:hypothetical protein